MKSTLYNKSSLSFIEQKRSQSVIGHEDHWEDSEKQKVANLIKQKLNPLKI